MAQWYYSNAQRERLGPVSADDLAQLHSNAQIEPDTLVWREGYSDWKPWREAVAEVVTASTTGVSIFDAPAATATQAASAFATAGPGAPANADANPYRIAEPISPYAPPKAQVRDDSNYIAGGRVVYAGFWKRAAAMFIDSFVVGIVAGMIGAILGVMMVAVVGASGDEGMIAVLQILNQIVGLALGATYYGWMHSSSMQASVGKLAVGIKVTRSDGTRISFMRGFGRYFGYILSSIPLGIGLIIAGFTDRKRALHDMICDTLVVDKYAFTTQADLQRDELGVVTIVILCLGGLLFIGMIALMAVAGFALFSSMR
jgi:uncharacterized RDD family membrane protein YckC